MISLRNLRLSFSSLTSSYLIAFSSDVIPQWIGQHRRGAVQLTLFVKVVAALVSTQSLAWESGAFLAKEVQTRDSFAMVASDGAYTRKLALSPVRM